jgi:hypothetical protein
MAAHPPQTDLTLFIQSVPQNEELGVALHTECDYDYSIVIILLDADDVTG